MDQQTIDRLLKDLGHIYDQLRGPRLEIGICGGAALLLTGLLQRTTTDIDLLYPTDLPEEFWQAAATIAALHGLPPQWINLGPKDLFLMGLPAGFSSRAIKKPLGQQLTAFLAGRRDQIFFKLYAAADRAGYHVTDLQQLAPNAEELLAAAQWCRTHDPSDGFRRILVSMLDQLGYPHVAKQL